MILQIYLLKCKVFRHKDLLMIQPDIKVLETLSSIKVFSSLDFWPLPKFIRCGHEEFFWLKGLSEKCGKRSLESRLSRRILFYRPFQTLWNVRCPKLHIFNTTSYPPHKLGCIECAFNKESFRNFATEGECLHTNRQDFEAEFSQDSGYAVKALRLTLIG